MGTGKKPGPKTDNPKAYKIGVKIDLQCKDILESYCKQETVSLAEAVRRGIIKLKADLTK